MAFRPRDHLEAFIPIDKSVGHSYTSNLTFANISIAHRQHFHKLRKENGIAVGGGRSAGTPRATPSKKTTAAKGKKRKVADKDEDNEDDEEDFGGRGEPSPSKKSKKEELKKEEVEEDEGFASQTASSFKTEELDEGGSVKRHQVIDLEQDE